MIEEVISIVKVIFFKNDKKNVPNAEIKMYKNEDEEMECKGIFAKIVNSTLGLIEKCHSKNIGLPIP